MPGLAFDIFNYLESEEFKMFRLDSGGFNVRWGSIVRRDLVRWRQV